MQNVPSDREQFLLFYLLLLLFYVLLLLLLRLLLPIPVRCAVTWRLLKSQAGRQSGREAQQVEQLLALKLATGKTSRKEVTR